MTEIKDTWEYEALCLRLPLEGHWAMEVESAGLIIEYAESELNKEISKDYRLSLHARIGKYKAILFANAELLELKRYRDAEKWLSEQDDYCLHCEKKFRSDEVEFHVQNNADNSIGHGATMVDAIEMAMERMK